jgi:cell wall-associated NlpC family hydrolase
MASGISGTGLALATAGGIMLWAGLSGASPLTILKTVGSGKAPPPADVGTLLSELGSDLFSGLGSAIGSALGVSNNTGSSGSSGSGTVNASVGTGSALGVAIANDAVKYVGTKYVYAGNTPATGWDCSGMVNYVLHTDLGYTIPNSRPTSEDYLTWKGATTVATADAQPGDLVCWLTHIIIAISNTEGVGAENPTKGTVTGAFNDMGPGGETFIIRRLNAVSQGTGGAVSA